MNPQNLTTKSQEALANSHKLAQEHDNSQIDPLHLLSVLINQSEGIVPSLMSKLGVNITYLENVTNASQQDRLINCTDTSVFTKAGLYNGFINASDLAGIIETLSVNGTIEPIIYIYFKDVYGNDISNYSASVVNNNITQYTVTNHNNPLNISPFYNGSLALGNYTFLFNKIGYY